MLERSIALLLAAAIVAVGGCLGGQGPASTSSTSASPEPKPLKEVVNKEVSGCAPSGSPAPNAPTSINFEVPDGYDTMLISFHETGVGQRRVWIYDNENPNTPIWERKQDNVNTLPDQCGSHKHGGDAETKTVEPGSYTARISYSGTLSMHLSVFIKSSKANATTSTTHSHATTKAL